MTSHPTARPASVTCACAQAWSNFLLTLVLTFSSATRPALLGLALPTLATQALLSIGIGWGSNVARMSYFIWSILVMVLAYSANDAATATPGWRELAGIAGDVGMVITLALLLGPAVNRWYLQQRTHNRAAPPQVARRRLLRNLKVATAWLLVLPLAALVALPFGTPLLAVLAASAPAACVGIAVAVRNAFKLYRLRLPARQNVPQPPTA